MPDKIVSRRDLPKAPYYVLSNDPFFSDNVWSDYKMNTVVCPCETFSEALFVQSKAIKRGDQKRVRIVTGKPKMNFNRVCYSLLDRDNASSWYTLHFEVSRANNPADGLKVQCEELREIERTNPYGGHYIDVKNAISTHLHSARTTVKDLGEAIARCAQIADAVGCRSISISPL